MDPEVMQQHLGCWVKWSPGRGAVFSSLGHTIRLPAPHHRTQESRMAWYIDIERLLGTLSDRLRRTMILWAQGHTQQCIALETGRSLRAVVRDCADTLELLSERLEDQKYGAKMFRHERTGLRRFPAPPRATSAETVKWMDAPRACVCRRKGRPPRVGVEMQLIRRVLLFGIALAGALTAAAQTAPTPAMAPATIVVNGIAMAGVVTIPAMTGASVFNGAGGTVFIADLTGNTTPTITNISPGQLYVFEFVQPPAAPAFTVSFPTGALYNCGTPVDMVPGSTTVYVAVGLPNSAVMCLNAMTVTPQ